MNPAEAAPGSSLSAAILTEAVLRLERQGPLEDTAELQQAFHTKSTRAAQLQERARLLGVRLGLLRELARWRRLVFGAIATLAVVVAVLALMTARAVLEPDRSINAILAFFSLLGWHGLTLGLWLLGFLKFWRPYAGQLSLARAALWLVAHMPFARTSTRGAVNHRSLLLESTYSVVRRARLWPWLTGMLSHTIWALSFLVVMVVLGFGFAFREYQLTWETTILSAGFFEHFVAVTGVLPSFLGFPVPDAAAVREVGNAAGGGATGPGQREWALWLLGCVVAYGLLPRVLFALFSSWRWRTGRERIAQPDMIDANVRSIIARLDALEPPPEVIDPEWRLVGPEAASSTALSEARGAFVLIGFELPPEITWPPSGLPSPAVTLEVSGSGPERQAAISQLLATRPGSLVVSVHAASSPDRGTARFLREVSTFAVRTALLLLSADIEVTASARRRWQDWLTSEKLATLTLVDEAAVASAWIASPRD